MEKIPNFWFLGEGGGQSLKLRRNTGFRGFNPSFGGELPRTKA